MTQDFEPTPSFPRLPKTTTAWEGHLANEKLYETAIEAYADEVASWISNELCSAKHSKFRNILGSDANTRVASEVVKYLILHMREEFIEIAKRITIANELDKK